MTKPASAAFDRGRGFIKDNDAVMDAQRDLADVVHVLKQVVSVKG